ncbi:MAG: CpaF/VirB11 family protein, partial [Acidimicrobiia bacterium]|nr:CpaF/VirB11 family protein [Acidimicrobiia bacterium]
LLLTLSSGVTGYTTIHAGSARQALTRLRFICQLSDTSNELPMSALNTLVSDSIDIVVHCVRTADGPKVSSVIAVEELQSAVDGTQFTVSEVFRRARHEDQLTWTGTLPVRAIRAFEEHGFDIRELLDIDENTDAPRGDLA